MASLVINPNASKPIFLNTIPTPPLQLSRLLKDLDRFKFPKLLCAEDTNTLRYLHGRVTDLRESAHISILQDRLLGAVKTLFSVALIVASIFVATLSTAYALPTGLFLLALSLNFSYQLLFTQILEDFPEYHRWDHGSAFRYNFDRASMLDELIDQVHKSCKKDFKDSHAYFSIRGQEVLDILRRQSASDPRDMALKQRITELEALVTYYQQYPTVPKPLEFC